MNSLLNSARSGDRFLAVIVVGAIALVVVALVAVVVAGNGGASPPADPESPAGVVFRYLEAVCAGDFDRADTLLTRTARSVTERDRRYPTSASGSTGESNHRLTIDSTGITGDTAEVVVTVSRFSTRLAPFSSGTYRTEYTVRLAREDSAWRISQPPPPYLGY